VVSLDVNPDELQKALDILQGLDNLLHHSGGASVDALGSTDDLQKDFNTWHDDGSQAVMSRHNELHREIVSFVNSLAGVAGQLAAVMQSTIQSVADTEDANKTGLQKSSSDINGGTPHGRG
jgi:hypothetical protein